MADTVVQLKLGDHDHLNMYRQFNGNLLQQRTCNLSICWWFLIIFLAHVSLLMWESRIAEVKHICWTFSILQLDVGVQLPGIMVLSLFQRAQTWSPLLQRSKSMSSGVSIWMRQGTLFPFIWPKVEVCHSICSSNIGSFNSYWPLT